MHFDFRSLRDSTLRSNGTDSESSDLSSIDSEQFLPQFAVKTNSEPFHGTQSALKRSSEPFHGTQSVIKTVGTRQISTSLNSRPVETSVPDVSKNLEKEQNRPVEQKLFNASKTITLENVKHTNASPSNIVVPRNQVKFPEPVVDKKGGVTQVDFRGVLKHKHSSKSSGAGDLNGHSVKLVNDKESLRLDLDNSKKGLSQKRQVFEQESTKIAPNCVHIVKTNETQKGLKVNEALKKFEDNTASAQSDFRNILKPRKENIDKKVTDRDKSVDRSTDNKVLQVDFRNVLKKNDTAKISEVIENRKVNQDKRIDQLSDSSFEKKSIQKQRAELVVNVRKKSIDKLSSTPKQKIEFDFTRKAAEELANKSDFKRVNKIDLEVPAVKSKLENGETKPVEFRSVLTRPERQNSKESSTDVLKPIPRRLSQSKQLIMDSKPEVIQKLENKSVDYGTEVTLECHVTGIPVPELSWSVNDKEIKVSLIFSQYSMTVLPGDSRSDKMKKKISV